MRNMLLVFACWSFGAGCQGVEVEPCELRGEGEFLPLAVGNWWLYDVYDRDDYRPADKTQVVREEERPGLFRLEKLACDPDYTWIEDTGTEYLWPRKLRFYPGVTTDIYYEPARLKWRYGGADLCEGASWFSDYQELSLKRDECDRYEEWRPELCSTREVENRSELWHSVGSESCSVGEHAYECVCAWRDDDGGDGPFCYARGVGKVREDTDTVEQLLDFCVGGIGPGGVRYPDGICPPPPDPREAERCAPAGT